MLLNPRKTKALMMRRSRTLNPPNRDLALSGIQILTSENLQILGMRFDCNLINVVQLSVVVLRVFERIGILDDCELYMVRCSDMYSSCCRDLSL